MNMASDTVKSRLMVSAYACEPWKGSEIGVGWHWVLELSREFEVWVITRANNQEPIEQWISQNPEYSNIHWVYFDLSARELSRKHGRKGVHRYYLKWTKASDKLIRETMLSNDIQTFMHITYGNVLWPVSHFGAGRIFIWGPVGGLETIPREYSCHYSLRSRVMETLRRIAVKCAPITPGFRRRCKKADLILCKTEITRDALPKFCQSKTLVMTDVAAEVQSDFTITSTIDEHNNMRLLCVGRLDAWRGFDLAIEAVASLRNAGLSIRLDILGKGPDKPRLISLAKSLAVDDIVHFQGEVSSDTYRRYMSEADILLNPSLKEGAVTVAFDTMAAGKPLVAIDTTGYTRYFGPDFSVIIPQGRRKEVIGAIVEAVTRLSDLNLRRSMGEAARKAASGVTWVFHGAEIRNAVRNVISGKYTHLTT